MDKDQFVEVSVTYDKGKKELQCSERWVSVFWTRKKASVRWVFRGEMPSGAVTAVLEAVDKVPAKYQQGVPGFIDRLPFRGVGTLPPSGGTAIPDLIAHGNRKIKGYFIYNILLLAADGRVVAEADPAVPTIRTSRRRRPGAVTRSEVRRAGATRRATSSAPRGA